MLLIFPIALWTLRGSEKAVLICLKKAGTVSGWSGWSCVSIHGKILAAALSLRQEKVY